MIGLLRFVSLMNAAVWLGAAVFFTLGADPLTSSQEMKDLLTPKNYPYFSVAIGLLVVKGYFHLYLACSLVALLHLVAEWLYFGKYPQKLWLGLLIGLCSFGLATGYWVQPRMKQLHDTTFAKNVHSEQRVSAGRSFRVWQGMFRTFNVLMIAGLAFYAWRIANPTNQTRFVSTAKFRS